MFKRTLGPNLHARTAVVPIVPVGVSMPQETLPPLSSLPNTEQTNYTPKFIKALPRKRKGKRNIEAIEKH